MIFALVVLLVAALDVARAVSGETEQMADNNKRANKWSYDTIDKWADDYPTCGNGQQQSPINLVTDHAVDCSFVKGEIDLASDAATEVHLLNTGYTAEVAIEGKSGSTEGGPFREKHDYELLQFHFHAPSENTVNGKQFPLEVHFVHKSKSHGGLGVLGVFFEVGHANEELDFLLDTPDQVGSVELEEAIPHGILKHHSVGSFYTFHGSLTTPPCTEGVQWAISSKIATISKEQLWAFTDRFGENSRPTQPVNHRKICFVDNHASDFSSLSSTDSSSSASSSSDSSSSSSSF